MSKATPSRIYNMRCNNHGLVEYAMQRNSKGIGILKLLVMQN
jgi:hypothetical protein